MSGLGEQGAPGPRTLQPNRAGGKRRPEGGALILITQNVSSLGRKNLTYKITEEKEERHLVLGLSRSIAVVALGQKIKIPNRSFVSSHNFT